MDRTTFRANKPPPPPYTNTIHTPTHSPQHTLSQTEICKPFHCYKALFVWGHTAAIQKPITITNAFYLPRFKNDGEKISSYLEYSCLKLQTSALKSCTVWRIATLASLLAIWKGKSSIHVYLFYSMHCKFVLPGWRLLCVLNSKRVLRMPFAGQNKFVDAKTTFSITNRTKKRKNKGRPHKNMQKYAIKEGSNSV